MKRQNITTEDAAILRQKAEEQLKKQQSKKSLSFSEADTAKLINELEVHQIELEMQNEELLIAKEKAELAEKKYTELYDFAPCGYLSISKDGEILDLNIAASQILGNERLKLIKKQFALFISQKTITVFNLFVKKVFTSKLKQTCEAIIAIEGNLPIYINAVGIVSQNNEFFLLTLTDITESKRVEEKLKASDRIFTHSLDMLCIAGFDGYFKILNPAWTDILGWSNEELLSKPLIDFVHPDDIDISKDIKSLIVDGKEVYQFENRYICKDGAIKWLSWNSFPYPDENIMFGVARNITQRKQVEAELIKAKERTEESEQRLKLAITSGKLGIWDWNVKENNMIWDERMFSLYGINPDSFPNNIDAWTNGLHPEDKQRAIDECNSALNGEKDFNTIFRVIHPDKTILYLKADAIIIRDNNNKPFRMIGVNKDITEQVYAELSLKQSENQFRNVWEKSKDGMRLIDENGKIIMVNQAFCQLFEKERDDLLQNSFAEVYANEIKEKIYEALIKKIKHDSIAEFVENNFKLWNGTKKWLQVSNAIIPKEDGKKLVLSIFRDITKQKQTEELYQKLKIAESTYEIKEQFFANMSHELRTPLSGVVGMADVLSLTSLDKKQEEYVKAVKDQSENLLQILNDILNLSKIEAGKMELHPTTINVEQFINSFQNNFLGLVKDKSLKLYVQSSEDFPKQIIIDETRLKQIINNLFTNAVKFTKEGTIKIKFFVAENLSNQRIKIKVEVADTGIGINVLDQKKLFLKFSQVDSSHTRAYGGTGLGLAICKELAKNLGGEIGVISEEGIGSTFWFTFIAEVPEEIEKTDVSVTPIIDEKIQAHVLLVEDNFTLRKVAELMLENIGCTVETAENGIKAIDVFEEGKFDIIFMDIQMPELNGVDTKLRSII